jgi:hypothetical protein
VKQAEAEDIYQEATSAVTEDENIAFGKPVQYEELLVKLSLEAHSLATEIERQGLACKDVDHLVNSLQSSTYILLKLKD